ncbi:MAG: hypothetical protein HYX55_04720 [Chloroflexi bacterium]|nr:hypothetical protein [Chloroflexota bacterium]
MIRIRATNTGAEPLNVVVFELAKLTWAELQAAVAVFDPAAPPNVTVLASLELPAGGLSTGYGTSPAGTLGVACATGSFDAPAITLAGPFPVGG